MRVSSPVSCVQYSSPVRVHMEGGLWNGVKEETQIRWRVVSLGACRVGAGYPGEEGKGLEC